MNLTPWIRDVVRSDSFRLNWLAGAELSVAPDTPGKSGLSFFFEHPAEWDSFRSAVPLLPESLAQEDVLRAAFGFIARRWVKLHFDGDSQTGASHYLVVDPRLHYPITTLRLALRRSGATDVSFIEPALEAALECRDSLWAVILKRDLAGNSRVCLSVKTQRALLPILLNNLAAHGRIGSSLARRYLAIDGEMAASPDVYLSFDLAAGDTMSLDYEEVAPSSIPDAFGELVPGVAPRYLKCRLIAHQDSPIRVGYYPLPELLEPDEMETLLQWRHGGERPGRDTAGRNSIVQNARDYYDREAESILRWGGATYQAGLLAQASAAETNAEWGARAGITPGDRVLDAGCGAGGPAIDLARANPDVHIDAITISAEQARLAQLEVQNAGVSARVRVSVADYHHLPFADRSFDRVLFLESIGYASDFARLFSEAFRVLKPGGGLFIKDVFQPERALTRAERLMLAEFDSVYAQQTPTPEEVLRAVIDAGFRVIGFEDISESLATGAFYRAMFEAPKVSAVVKMGLAAAPDEVQTLTPFGARHFRHFERFPLRFGQLRATRP